MAIDYDLDQNSAVVFIRIYGSLAITDVESTLNEIHEGCNDCESILALIDARDIKRAFFIREMDRLIEVFSEAEAISDFGLVIGSNLVLQDGRRFLVRARKRGLNLSVFRDHATASKWAKQAVT